MFRIAALGLLLATAGSAQEGTRVFIAVAAFSGASPPVPLRQDQR